MAILYSIGNGPTGLVIDPATGELSLDGPVPEGVYNVEVYTTDTDTGITTLCKVVQFSCAPDEDGISCTQCIEQHLIDHPHIPKTDIDQCIDEKIAQFGVDWIPPEPQKDCCDKKVLRFSYCGRVFDMLDWDGDGVIDINLTPGFVSYTTPEPDPADAVIAPQFNNAFQTLPGMPISMYAGPPGPNHGLEHITHISDGKTWIPLCCGTGGTTPNPGTQECCLIPSGSLSYPLAFDTNETLWQIGSTIVRFPGCGISSDTLCAVGAGAVYRDDIPTTGTAKPPTALYTQNNELFVAPDGFTGCSGTLQDISVTAGGEHITVNFGAWLGNGGTIDPATVQSIRLCFDVNGSAPDLGVGLFDLFGDGTTTGNSSYTWQPVTSVTGPAAANNADYARITGAGSYEIEFGFNLAALANNSNSLEPVFFGISDDETVSNLRLKIVSSEQQPCGLVNSPAETAQLLTDNDPNGHQFYINANGDICALIEPVLCDLYQTPSFSAGDGITCCLVTSQQFPVTYDPLTDGWVVGTQRIFYGGSGVFQTAEQMAAWMTSNDPLSNVWTATLTATGDWNICASVSLADKTQYKFLSYNGADTFKCVLEDTQFPLSYSNGDGWVIDSTVYQFPTGSVWFTANDLALWMESVDPYNNDWTAYLNNTAAQTFSICGNVRPELCESYNNLTYNNSDKFCCQAQNLAYPLAYDPANDGWIVNNQIIQFGGDGTYTDAQELLGFIEANDPNGYNWEITPGAGGTTSICTWMPDGECDQYGGLIISGGQTYYCDIQSLAFPYTYNPLLEGWSVNGQVIGFTGDGTFETPAEFAAWLNGNDPNGYNWGFQTTQTAGVFDFCAFMPVSSTSGYNGIQQPQFVCNELPHEFPYTYNSADGWLINNEILSYYEVNGAIATFGTATQFAQWLTDNDPNGYTWIHNGSPNPGFHLFCAVMPASEQNQYQGFFDGQYYCLTDTITFPKPYNTANGGWTVDGVFIPFGGDGTWDTLQELLDWVNSNDPHENLWVSVNNNQICGYIESGENPLYTILAF